LKNKVEIAGIIKEINPVLRNWGNYFNISYHSQNTFIKIGHYVWGSMMRWVSKKNTSHSIFKAVSKYIVTGKTNSNHKWVWGINNTDNSKINNLVITNLAETKIKKHPLLKLDLNPYLLENQNYFLKRLIKKNSAKFTELIYIKYNHQCPLCLDSLHNGEQVELHHIIPVREGGNYSVSNIQPLHQICHISVTHRTDNYKE
jgi:RNA-directed DNA polymerase